MALIEEQSKLSQRLERAIQSPRLMMLYPPVSTGVPYEGAPDARELWESAAGSGTLYVHVPFCHRRCPFCPFYAVVPNNGECDTYLADLVAEARLYAPAVDHMRFSSVYLGGGTPSILTPRQVRHLLHELASRFDMKGADITLEAHPANVDRTRIRELCAAGITRLSIGVQSFDSAVLSSCGRGGEAEAMQAVEAALEAPLRDLNLDFMYGLPGQSLASWKRDLERVVRLKIPSVTLYATVYLPAFQASCLSQGLAIPTASERDEMYEVAYEYLNASGYPQPHFGAGAFLRGQLNAHRRNVLLGRPTLGLGAWAYSSTGRYAYHNQTPIPAWAQQVRQGRLPIGQLVQVAEHERARKHIVESLLLAYVDRVQFHRHCGVTLEEAFPNELAVLERSGMAHVVGDELRLTRAGGRHLREIRYLFASEAVVAALEADESKGL